MTGFLSTALLVASFYPGVMEASWMTLLLLIAVGVASLLRGQPGPTTFGESAVTVLGATYAGLLTGTVVGLRCTVPDSEGRYWVFFLLAVVMFPTRVHERYIVMCMPFVALLVSGGHCQFLLVEGEEDFTRLGGTIDDAPGEAFDKTAKLLGLPYPGGPALARLASEGDDRRFEFPRPMTDRPGLDMSFSGLKTHTRNPVPLLAWGPGAELFVAGITRLDQVTPSIVGLLT